LGVSVVHIDLGSLPDWLSGVGTVLAFFFGLRLLGKELQAHREADQDRRRMQARRVAAWYEERTADAEGVQRGPVLRLENGSDEPVYICAVLFAAPHAETWGATTHDEWRRAIGATGAINGARGAVMLPPGNAKSWELAEEELTAPVPVFLMFRDTQGIAWSRSPRGVLREQSGQLSEQVFELMTRAEEQS
jgi:hypothetical protein